MSERNYYVICDDNCKFEGMTKQQIYDAIAEVTGNTPTPVDEAFITQIKEQNANKNLKVWKGTEAQYNALQSTDPDTVYFIGTNQVKDLDDIKSDIYELQTEVQPINRGGTGATDAEAAARNLGFNDYVVETIIKDGWVIRKYKSGIWEMEGIKIVSFSNFNASGNVWRASKKITLPNSTIDADNCISAIVSGHELGAWVTCSSAWGTGAETGQLELLAFKGTSGGSISMKVSIRVVAAIGTEKLPGRVDDDLNY